MILAAVDRGRKERMAFADSFIPAYHFRLLYSSSAMMYPIRGALRHVYGGPWEVSDWRGLSYTIRSRFSPYLRQVTDVSMGCTATF